MLVSARRLHAVLIALGVVVSATMGLSSAATAGTPSATASAVTWPSGAYLMKAGSTSGAAAFGNYRGTPDTVAVVYASRTSWSDFATNLWGVKQYAGFPGRLSVAVPLTIGSATLSQVAAGNYDSYFSTWAQNLAAAGRGDSDIRLGWEFNGNWMPWSALDANAFVAAFRHVSSLIKAALPNATIDWNGNWGTSQSKHNPFTELYPGDAYVDVVGLDAYDGGWIPANTDQSFATWETSSFGLQDWLNFAEAHGKKFAVPEWGLMSSGEGDNPAFVRGMFNFFAVNAAHIAYESYFSGADNSLYSPVTMPNASAEYERLWSQTTPANGASPAATTFTTSGTTDVWGYNHTLSAAGLPGTATGTVAFSTGSTALCSASVVNGTAACKGGSALNPGSYPVVATYSGDSTHAAGSVSMTLTVLRRAAAAVFSATATTVAAGQSTSLSMSGLPGIANETVSFTSGGRTLCAAAPVGGKAHCPTATSLAAGTYQVTATWPGDALFTPTTATGAITVQASGVDAVSDHHHHKHHRHHHHKHRHHHKHKHHKNRHHRHGAGDRQHHTTG